jgi:hypothetical protein
MSRRKNSLAGLGGRAPSRPFSGDPAQLRYEVCPHEPRGNHKGYPLRLGEASLASSFVEKNAAGGGRVYRIHARLNGNA